MGIQMVWNDARRSLTLRLAAGSKMLPPVAKEVRVKVGAATKSAVFDGRIIELLF
jgi:hypothetical protein